MTTRSIRSLLFASITVFALLSAPAYSSGGSVNLAATLKNAPAFAPVTWKVLRLDNNAEAGSATAHSANIPLTPGTYRAVASYGGVTRDRTFTVGNSGQVNVVIAMD